MSCRVDLAQAVCTLSQKMSNPDFDDANLLRHTLRYLDNNRYLSLTYKREGNAIEELLADIDRRDPSIFSMSGAYVPADILGMHDR